MRESVRQRVTNRTDRVSGAVRGLGTWLERVQTPTMTYYLLIGATTVLVGFGLIMVLSASSVVSLANTKSSYTVFRNQLIFAVLGTIAILIAVRLKPSVWKRLALPIMLAAIALQGLVFSPIGKCVAGNCNWIEVAGMQAQPSEVVKLALALLGAAILAAKRHVIGQFRHVVVPYLVPFAAVSIGLVLYGEDLGTVLILGTVVGAVLWAAGVPARYFGFAGVTFLAVAVAMVIYSPNRLGRFDVWLGRDTNPYGMARQPIHGRYALADGGWVGLGLGGSREKWLWLSEPHNDFIFAIIGEELGLAGTLLVITLFLLIAYACYRLVVTSDDLFVRLATAGIMGWIVVQAMINIGSVIGMVPVIGVNLPLVSSGGSSLITTMAALGVLISFARHEPACAAELASRPRRRLIPSTVRHRLRRER
ncbi:MAG TPA: putative lipid II flippase FtsW [Intrasporangiaceae bacterium]|nr:putative lipid II flippase FtsW [Intrasporangiaceae bacterium]